MDYLGQDDYSEAVTRYNYYNCAINYSDCLILKNMDELMEYMKFL